MKEAGDRLSPILVKEFRQGVRGHAFTAAFLLLHGLMVLATAIAIMDRTGASGQWFWPLLVLPIGVLLPLSGSQALVSESTSKTLEPMLLTRLSARSIVVGKWISLGLQNGLLVVSIAPYVLFRYFLGGFDLAREAWLLLDLTVSAGLLTAITVAFSAFRLSAIFRWVVCIPLMGGAVGLMQPFFTRHASGVATGGGSWLGPLIGVGLALLTTLVVIESGAWQIAPAADRSSLAARVMLLAAMPLLGVGVRSLPSVLADPAVFWMGAIVVLLCIGVLCEPVTEIPSTYSAFFGRGALRRAAGWLLAPGWASGVLFTTVAVTAACLAAHATDKSSTAPHVMVAILAALLLPCAIRPLFAWGDRRPLPFYLLVQLASFGMGTLAPIGQAAEAPAFTLFAAWLMPLSPLMHLLMEMEQPDLVHTVPDGVAQTLASLVIAVTLAHAARALRRTERLVRERAVSRSPSAGEAAAPSPVGAV